MTVLCYIDTETTGLDPRIHQPYEVSWWREDHPEPWSLRLPHTLALADPRALEIGGYWDRGFAPGDKPLDQLEMRSLTEHLRGVTLVGANPSFDAAMLTPVLGVAVWHYRFVDVSTGAMWVFGWDRPRSLLETSQACRDRGYEIPEPDHTAEGDVRATRAVHLALRSIREGMGA